MAIESTGYTYWFAEMLAELGHELIVGDAAKIRASVTRKRKHHRREKRRGIAMACGPRLDAIAHEAVLSTFRAERR